MPCLTPTAAPACLLVGSPAACHGLHGAADGAALRTHGGHTHASHAVHDGGLSHADVVSLFACILLPAGFPSNLGSVVEINERGFGLGFADDGGYYQTCLQKAAQALNLNANSVNRMPASTAIIAHHASSASRMR